MQSHPTGWLFGCLLIVGSVSHVHASCGEVAIEGYCDGNVRTYCNTADVVTETCTDCCGWNGARYDCLTDCPAPGECVDECNDVSKFGCSLENTHEWTCAVGDDGCTHRTYIACGSDQICDESTTHQCAAKSNVDVCGPIPSHGICQGNVFKQCVNGEIEQTDCSAAGLQCGPTGCTDCVDVCEEGTAKCLAGNKQSSCVAFNGCFQWSGAKSCGIKTCVDGQCIVPSTPPDDNADAGNSAEVTVEPPPNQSNGSSSQSSGGCIMGLTKAGMLDGSLMLLATILGLILFRNSFDNQR